LADLFIKGEYPGKLSTFDRGIVHSPMNEEKRDLSTRKRKVIHIIHRIHKRLWIVYAQQK